MKPTGWTPASAGETNSREHFFPSFRRSAIRRPPFTLEALKAAKQAGVTVSYDLNYRGKLWPPDKAQAVQEPMMEFVDVLMTAEEDAKVVFEVELPAGPMIKVLPKSLAKLTRMSRASSAEV